MPDAGGAIEKLGDCLDGAIINRSVDRDHIKPERFDIRDVDGIAVDKDRFPVVDRFEERVAEPFDEARVGHEISTCVGIVEIKLRPVAPERLFRTAHQVIRHLHLDRHGVGHAPKRREILHPLIACGV